MSYGNMLTNVVKRALREHSNKSGFKTADQRTLIPHSRLPYLLNITPFCTQSPNYILLRTIPKWRSYLLLDALRNQCGHFWLSQWLRRECYWLLYGSKIRNVSVKKKIGQRVINLCLRIRFAHVFGYQSYPCRLSEFMDTESVLILYPCNPSLAGAIPILTTLG